MNLRIKINLAILLTFVIIAMVYAAILFPFERQRQQTVIEQVKLTLRGIIAQRQGNLADEIFGRQHEAIKITINELLKVKGIAAIHIYLADGSLFESGGIETKPSLDLQQLEMLTIEPRFIRKVFAEKPLLNLACSIEVIGEHVGFIEVDYDLSRVEEEVGTLKMISLAMLATILFAMFGLLNLLLSKMVLKPIYNLSETIKKIQDGALGEQVNLQTRDEMGSMATAFNEMSVELAELTHGLEKRVDERTQQLFQTNSELEKARAVAESSTEQKSEFLANMSHEIRSPMNAIIGLSHLALKTELTPKLRDYLEKIESSSRALLNIINDILDFSKIEAGRLSLESIPFQLDDVLDNLSSMVAIKAEERGVELILHTGKGVPNQLLGDPLRLGQVLLNLTTNAIKFTDKGHVLIRIERIDHEEAKDELLRFSVIDTGIGLSEQQITKLFQSFSQADSSTTRRYGGTGLGLSICKNIVELMGSTIEVKSVVGKGSTFSFSTSFRVDKSVNTLALNDIYGDRLSGMKVLVVDDNAVARQIISDHLEVLKLEISQVSSGLEAVAELENGVRTKGPYQLVLMDWKMEGMDGIEASRTIKQNPVIVPSPKIIMVTSYGYEEIVVEAYEAGIDGYLVKPVEQRLLLKTVGLVLTGESVANDGDNEKMGQNVEGLAAIQGSRVLVVEDNEINQQVAAELIIDAGLEVEIAKNGLLALQRITVESDAERFDLVFMDIQMPVMDGHTATRKIRAAGTPLSNVPIIAMTAHAMESERRKCLENGMNDHLSKPIDPELLQKTLVQWIQPKRYLSGSPSQAMDRKEIGENVNLLPEKLQGFDLNAGLSRVAGKRKLYHELLLKFAGNHQGSRQRIHEMLDKQSYRQGQHLAHALKGNAGNLGAMRLYAAAAELEQAFVAVEKIEPILETFDYELQLVLDSLSTLQQHPENIGLGQVQRSEELDLEQVNSVIEQLQQQITSDYGQALELISRLQSMITGSKIVEQVGNLAEYLNNFDEDRARSELLAIQQRLNSGKREGEGERDS